MKYIRNLHSIDDRVPSVSPQIGKEERPFVGIVVMVNGRKYCIPLSKCKATGRDTGGFLFNKHLTANSN